MTNTVAERLEAYRELCAKCEVRACSSRTKCDEFHTFIEKKRVERGKERSVVGGSERS